MDYTKNVENTKKYILTHLDEDFTPEYLAQREGYSLFHFCRIFKEYSGESLMRFVRNSRMEKACRDIKNGMSIADTAEKYCYETPSGFIRAYKKIYGKDYRQSV